MIPDAVHSSCMDLLNVLICKEMQESWSWIFMHPVSISDVPDYFNVIKKPMDLGKVIKNLGSKPSRCRFKSYEKFVKDVRLVFQNALFYNRGDADKKGSVYDAAQFLLEKFENAYQKAYSDILIHCETGPQASPGSTPVEVVETIVETNGEMGISISEYSEKRVYVDPSTIKEKKKEVKIEMGTSEIDECLQVVKKLMEKPQALPFLDPVDVTTFVDYPNKIKNMKHLRGIKTQLHKKGYASKADFEYDIRLVFSNCLAYNSDGRSNDIRLVSIDLIKQFEKLWTKHAGKWKGIPSRWQCQIVLDQILSHTTNGEQTSQWFRYPLETYFASADQVPTGYFKIVKSPMDLASVSANLHLGIYKQEIEFFSDLQLTFRNCIAYWKSDAQGSVYCDLANAMLTLVDQQIAIHFPKLADALGKSLSKNTKQKKSSAKENETTTATSSSSAKKERKPVSKRKSLIKVATLPEKEQCLELLLTIKNFQMTGPDGVLYPAARPFKRPVDASLYTDYAIIVTTPMDLSKVERKLKTEKYTSIDKFATDMRLIFQNCMTYNSDPVTCLGIRHMATTLLDKFNELYIPLDGSRVKRETLAAEQSKALAAEERKTKKAAVSQSVTASPLKHKMSSSEVIKALALKNEKSSKKKNKTSSNSQENSSALNSSALIEQLQAASSSKATTTSLEVKVDNLKKGSKKRKSSGGTENAKKRIKKEDIVPLDLPEPEKSCDKVLRKFLRMSLMSKFHFDTPIYTAFPEIRDHYFQKIANPQDLGKIRKALQNREYETNPQSFIEHGRLVFQNAITYNSVSAEEDDYARHVCEVAQHMKEYFNHCCAEYLPLFGSREEQEAQKVRKQELRTWRENKIDVFAISSKSRECSKVLRSMHAQKYDKVCWPFRDSVQKLFPDLPGDYFDVVVNLMDLKTVSERVSGASSTHSMYHTYGEFVSDMRLTFQNSINYNKADATKEIWTVYGAAVEMLAVFDELWAESSLDIFEKSGRDDVVRRSNAREMAKTRAIEMDKEHEEQEIRIVEYEKQMEIQRISEAAAEEQQVALNVRRAKEAGDTRTETKEARMRLEKMSKEDRKKEEKRRRHVRREDDRKKTEMRRKYAVAATDDALKEAELRSRQNVKKQETILKAENDRANSIEQEQIRKCEEKIQAQMFNISLWKGTLNSKVSSTSFWKRMDRQPILSLPPCFEV